MPLRNESVGFRVEARMRNLREMEAQKQAWFLGVVSVLNPTYMLN